MVTRLLKTISYCFWKCPGDPRPTTGSRLFFSSCAEGWLSTMTTGWPWCHPPLLLPGLKNNNRFVGVTLPGLESQTIQRGFTAIVSLLFSPSDNEESCSGGCFIFSLSLLLETRMPDANKYNVVSFCVIFWLSRTFLRPFYFILFFGDRQRYVGYFKNVGQS